MSGPDSATPYGKIAYRIDEVAASIIGHSEHHDEAARKLWGIVDDLVALNMAADADRAVLDAAEVIKRDHQRTVMVLGGARFPCQCSICVSARARREAQT